MLRKVDVLLPVYNEGEGVYKLLKKFSELASEYEFHIHVINDCSIDNSLDWIYKAKSDFALLSINVFTHKTNKGLHGALKTGFEILSTRNIDYLITMDGDNTHNPYLISSMVQKIDEGADIVIASRYCNQSRVVGLSKLRIFLSYGARLFYTFFWRITGASDYTCLFRVYRGQVVVESLAKYRDNFVEETGFTCSPEILRKMARVGPIVVEVPMILVYSDKVGASNMNVMPTVKLTLKSLFKNI